MLLALTQWLAQDVRAFNVFQYITLRAVLATLTALAISLLAGPLVIRKLTAYKIGQAVRDDGPQSHLTKAGTPTMGGALVLLSILITTLLWGDLSNRFVWVVLVVTFGFGAIGWIDDYRKVVKNNPKGLSPKAKFFWQSLIGLVAATYLAFAVSAPRSVHAQVKYRASADGERRGLRSARNVRTLGLGEGGRFGARSAARIGAPLCGDARGRAILPGE